MTPLEKLNVVVLAYLECVDFTDLGPDCEFSSKEFAPETVLKAASECADFLSQALTTCPDYFNPGRGESPRDRLVMLGHDFWLTRNRHGAGFWDRGLGALGETLSKMAKVHGAQGTYEVGGLVYLE